MMKHSNLVSAISCSFLLLHVAHAAEQQFSPAALSHKAEIEGYGYKSSNLMILRDALADKEPHVHVPEFLPLSSGDGQDLLTQVQLNLLDEWALIVSKLMDPVSIDLALASKTFPPGLIDASTALSEQIKKSFIRLSERPNQLPSLQKFLDEAKTHNWRLMVRSTGKEDTDKLANAGGNKSVANVSPNAKDVLAAIGEVIGSYFEKRSLTQRLSAGDKTIFDPPLTPVLIQRMIGETVGGADNIKDIPVGCVLYTTEPGGKLASVDTLQCAPGHNEGVVQSLVPLDTYYVSRGHMLRSLVKIKTKRLVPMVENDVFGLEEVANPEAIQKHPALHADAIQSIAQVGRFIDAFYKKRMDIELVYEPASNVIHIVQARPLVIPENEEGPSYIVQVTQFNDEQTIHSMIISIGSGSVQRIHQAAEMIVANTLEDALKFYALPSTNRARVKTVVVKQQADPTSHASATFRGDGKTIFVSEDIDKLKQWLKQQNIDLLIDGQRELTVNLASTTLAGTSMRALFEDRVLKSGWLNYPLPLRVSIEAHQPQYCLAPQMKIDRFSTQTKCLVDRLRNEVKDFGHFVEYTHQKATCDPELPGCLEQRAPAQQVMTPLTNLYMYADRMLQELPKRPEDLTRLEDLFPRRFLEALVYQKPGKDVVASYSIGSVKEDYQKYQAFVQDKLKPQMAENLVTDNLLRDDDMFAIAEHSSKIALTKQASEGFIRFVDTVATKGSTKEKDELKTLVSSFESLQMMPLWLNSIFVSTLREELQQRGIFSGAWQWAKTKLGYGYADSINLHLLARFYQDYQQSAADLQRLAAMKAALASYDVSAWENPTKFEQNRKKFDDTFLKYFESNDFLQHKTVLHAMAATSLMENFVETFDLSIKALKGSQEYKNPEEKLRHFKTRIEDSLGLLEKWALSVPAGHIVYHSEWPLQVYLATVKELLAAKIELTDVDLLPSRDFSVAAASLGAGTSFERHFPKTLEDFFTLMHQSLNVVNGALVQLAIAGRLDLPENFAQVFAALQQGQFRIVLTGIQMRSDGLLYSINMPLQNHSARLLLKYNLGDGSVDLNFQFMGQARERWSLIEAYSMLMSDALALKVSDVKSSELEIQLTFKSVHRASPPQIALLAGNLGEIANSEAISADMIDDANTNQPTFFQTWMQKAGRSEDPIKFRSALNLYGVLLKRDKNYSDAEQMAKRGAQSPDTAVQESALKLMTRLVDESQALDAAEGVARLRAGSEDIMVRYADLLLLASLAGRQRAYALAIEEAKMALLSENELVQSSGIQLFARLLNAGQAMALGEQLAASFTTSERPGSKFVALCLYGQLVGRDLALSEAEDAAKKGASSSDPKLQSGAVMLFRQLVTKGKALNAAEEAANRISTYRDPAVKSMAISLFGDLVRQKRALASAEAAAIEGVMSENQQVSGMAISLFQPLFEQNIAYDSAEKAARSMMASGVAVQQRTALRLLGTLVFRDKALALSEELLARLPPSSDSLVQVEAMGLYGGLVDKKLAFAISEQIASRHMNSEIPSEQRAALNLFLSLISKDQAFVTAEQAAVRGIMGRDNVAQRTASNILGNLVSKGRAYESAEKAAMACLARKESGSQRMGVNLLNSLAEKGRALAVAEAAVSKILEARDQSLRDEYFALLLSLVNQGHGYTTAERVIKAFAASPDPNTYSNSLLLATALVNKNLALVEGEELAHKAIKDSDASVRSGALTLYAGLVRQGRALDEAEDAVRRSVADNDPQIQNSLLSLLANLVVHGKAFIIAEEVAKAAIVISDSYRHAQAFSLFTQLVNQGQALVAAREAINLGMSGVNEYEKYYFDQLKSALEARHF